MLIDAVKVLEPLDGRVLVPQSVAAELKDARTPRAGPGLDRAAARLV